MDQRAAVTVLLNEGQIAFPESCPACGTAANVLLAVERVFTHIRDQGESTATEYVVGSYQAPFCQGCFDRHRREQASPDPWLPVKRLLKGDGRGIGGAVICCCGLWMAWFALTSQSLFPLIPAGFAFLVGGNLLASNWRRNRRLAVAAPTSVTATVDFTDDLSQSYEPPWRTFRFTDPAYARRFSERNAGRLWDPHGTEARVASEKRKRAGRWKTVGVGLVVALVFGWWLWDDVLRPAWPQLAPWWDALAVRFGLAR